MNNSDERFITVYSKRVGMKLNEIVVDTQTGVNYFFHISANSGGITPLFDSDGKVVVSKEYINNSDN